MIKTIDEAIRKALWDGAKINELLLLIPGAKRESGSLETQFGAIEVRESAYLPSGDEGYVINKRACGIGYRDLLRQPFRKFEI